MTWRTLLKGGTIVICFLLLASVLLPRLFLGTGVESVSPEDRAFAELALKRARQVYGITKHYQVVSIVKELEATQASCSPDVRNYGAEIRVSTLLGIWVMDVYMTCESQTIVRSLRG